MTKLDYTELQYNEPNHRSWAKIALIYSEAGKLGHNIVADYQYTCIDTAKS